MNGGHQILLLDRLGDFPQPPTVCMAGAGLARELAELLKFGPCLTVVYGDNAAGKTG